METEQWVIERLIKQKAWEWSKKDDLVEEKLFVLWNNDLSQAYSNHRKSRLRYLINKWFTNNKVVGFIDGALSKDHHGIISAGIGGFLIDQKSKVWFIFAGPSYECNSLYVEKQALHFILQSLSCKGYDKLDAVVASDSHALVSIYNSDDMLKLEENAQLANLKAKLEGVKVVYINRRLNSEADRLAGEGKGLSSLRAGWLH